MVSAVPTRVHLPRRFVDEESLPSALSLDSDNPSKGNTEADRTMARIRASIQRQETRKDAVQDKMDALVQEALTKKTRGDKRGTLNCLKKLKMYEQEVEKIDAAVFTMETQIMSIEASVENSEMMEAMRAG